MSQERSSSNRVCEIKDAVLLKNERTLGPMRLPLSRPNDFIDHFNRTYEGLGMTLSPNAPDQIREIPGSREATGDQN